MLCTSNKTYHLRQVHTSNSVHLTQPVSLSARPDGIATPGISAIAKCGSVLEAHPVNESPVSALREALTRIWHHESWGGDSIAQFSGELVRKRKEDFFADIPFSDAECEQAWVELCAFEFADGPVLPTLPTLWTYWKTIFTTAVAEGIDLGAQFQITHLAKTLQDEGELFSGLVEAIFHRLLPDDQMGGDDCRPCLYPRPNSRLMLFRGRG